MMYLVTEDVVLVLQSASAGKLPGWYYFRGPIVHLLGTRMRMPGRENFPVWEEGLLYSTYPCRSQL